jgi:hypothetical protein
MRMFDVTRYRRGKLRSYLGVLAILMVFARGLIPTGFMPGAAHGNGVFAICAGLASGSEAAGDADSKSGTHAGANCVFAQSAGTAPLPQLALFAGPIAAPLPYAALPISSVSAYSGRPLNLAPRGPPQLS